MSGISLTPQSAVDKADEDGLWRVCSNYACVRSWPKRFTANVDWIELVAWVNEDGSRWKTEWKRRGSWDETRKV